MKSVIWFILLVFLIACSNVEHAEDPLNKYMHDNYQQYKKISEGNYEVPEGIVRLHLQDDQVQAQMQPISNYTSCIEGGYDFDNVQCTGPLGQIYNAEKMYVHKDIQVCYAIRFTCKMGQVPFYDDEGCGCEPITLTDYRDCISAGFPVKNGTCITPFENFTQ